MNRWGILMGICSAVLVFCAAVFAGNTITVGPGGSGGGYDYATIQAGIDAAVNGDTVLVADGTYTGSGNRDISFGGKAILLQSANGPENCIIDCEGLFSDPHRGFIFNQGEGHDSVLSGFSIINGYVLGDGGGIAIGGDSSPTIDNCIVSGNTTGDAGPGEGIYEGGGICCAYGSNAVIQDCLIINNTLLDGSGQGGGIKCGEGVTISHCTIVGNSCRPNAEWTYGGGISCYKTHISHCIIRGNVAAYGARIFYSTAPYLSFCNVEGGESGIGIIDADPLFVDASGGDYHLTSASPCRDAGNMVYEYDPRGFDIDSEPRVMGGVPDMGFDEFTDAVIPVPVMEVSSEELTFFHKLGDPPVQSQNIQIQNVGTGEVHWQVSESCSWVVVSPASGVSIDEANDIQVIVDSNGLQAGDYRCELTISDGNSVNSPVAVTVNLMVSQMDLSFECDTYAYAKTGNDLAWDTDEDSSVYSGCESKAMASDYEDEEWHSNFRAFVEGAVSPSMVVLVSDVSGSGVYPLNNPGSGEGNGYTMLTGTVSVGIPDGYHEGVPLPTMTVCTAVGGSNPSSWDTWDWWVRIWRDDPCTPLAVLNDANMSDGLEVFAGETLNIEFYHEAGDGDWPSSGLSSVVQVVVRLCSVADLDTDGYVGLKDYGMLASQWQQAPSVPSADIAPVGWGDGKVDSNDLLLLAENWLVGAYVPFPLSDPCSGGSYWALEEGTGSIAVDSVGENHGNITGANWAVGQVGWWSLEFDGDNDNVTVPDDESLDFGAEEDFSISLWFKIGVHLPNDGVHLVNKRESGGAYQGYIVFYEDRSDQATYRKVGLFLDLGSSGATVISDSYVDDGAWHHLVVQREGTTLRLYLDGVQEGGDVAGTGYDADLSNSNPLIFGMNRTLEYKDYYGRLDEIMIYRKALTMQEVQDLYQYGLNN